MTIRQRYHRDLEHLWTVSDLRDIDGLSIATPYCDVVVTDNAVRTAITRAILDHLLSTVVISNLEQLTLFLPTSAGPMPSGS